MTESLFFSQIASKSLAAKSKSATTPKSYQGDSSAFDKHLSLPDRRSDRGEDRDNVTDFKKEPRFTKETRSRDYGNDERAEPKIRDEKRNEGRLEHAETKEALREQSTAKTQEKTSEQPNNDATNTAKSDQNSKETASSPGTATTEQSEDDTLSGDDGVLALLTQVEEEFTPETSEKTQTGTDETTSAQTQTSQAAAKTETAEIVPLFKGDTPTSEQATQSATDALASAQTTQTQTTQAEEITAQQAIKQPRQTPTQNAEAQIAAKITNDGTKPGLNKALANVSADASASAAKAEVVEVQNASKNASFLGEVNVEQAQKTDKSEIKARIGDLAQKTVNGPVATSMQVKTAQITPHLANAKPEGLGQIQPLATDTAITSTQNIHSVQVRFGSLPQTTQSAQIPVTTMAFHIAKSVENGVNRFEIRIDPPELGRVEVKLEVNQAGRVIANLTVERPETLDLLQRDQRALERALQDAGLDVGGDSLNFSLKDQSAHNSDEDSLTANQIASTSDEEESSIEPEMITGYISNSGVDIRI